MIKKYIFRFKVFLMLIFSWYSIIWIGKFFLLYPFVLWKILENHVPYPEFL